MKLSNATYDKLKYIVQIVIPALLILIAGLGNLYEFDTTKIIGLLTLLTTFSGTVLGISSLHYNQKEDK